MNERIEKLASKVASGELYIDSVEIEYDREDLFLSPVLMSAKRVKEFILAQKPYVTELTALTGYIRFSDGVEGDIFNRRGHKNYQLMMEHFYNNPVSDLCTFEWQHSVADFEKVIKIGINGYKNEIKKSKEAHSDKDSLEFLEGLDIVADAIIGWANKCSKAALDKAKEVTVPQYKRNLEKLAEALKRVPAKPARSFYEAVLTIFIIYAFVPDSIGTIDRYLYPFYLNDIACGDLTEEDAKAYLQELYLMLQSRISKDSDRFYRGGESHFAIGGYLENGEDGFTEFSKLVLDAMLELPTHIPQISLRWNKKTPKEVLRYAMDCERRDPNKRIAFVNDEPRIQMLTEWAGFPYELACKYTMVGCNEPQLPGGIFMGGNTANILKAIENTLYGRTESIFSCKNFDEFYAIFDEELEKTLNKITEYYNKFQEVRSRDVNLVSTMFFEGSIERAKSITMGGAKNAIADIILIGLISLVDSLAIIKQYVYEEKKISLAELVEVLKSNWETGEELRAEILKKGSFFGNNSETSNECINRLGNSIEKYFKGRKTDLGYTYVTGNLIGYNQHHKWFGDKTKATPDGRRNGAIISYGVQQNDGKDRESLTALLKSTSEVYKYNIFCGSAVTNILLDEQLIKNDANFEKTVDLFETYFKFGGMHFQLNYVSKEDLVNAKANPEKYRNLRVRVSGYSDFFRNLNEDLQDEIITRTAKKG